MSDPLIQIVAPRDGWVLNRLGSVLAERLPGAIRAPLPLINPSIRLLYYVNYALYRRPSGRLDVGFFTHPEGNSFVEIAREMDHCVCMAEQYAELLRREGVEHVTHIPMGYDSERYRPKLYLGVASRIHHPRKGRQLLERVRKLPWVRLYVSGGHYNPGNISKLYQQVDYVLITSTVEGGPMSLLEGLGMGKPVIAPAGVGIVPELPASPYLLTYPAGDYAALEEVLVKCFAHKCRPSLLLPGRSWDRWAAAHQQLFSHLLTLRAKGL